MKHAGRRRGQDGWLIVALLLAMLGHLALMAVDVHAAAPIRHVGQTTASRDIAAHHMSRLPVAEHDTLPSDDRVADHSPLPDDRPVPNCAPGWRLASAPQRDIAADAGEFAASVFSMPALAPVGAAVDPRTAPTLPQAVRRALLQVYRI